MSNSLKILSLLLLISVSTGAFANYTIASDSLLIKNENAELTSENNFTQQDSVKQFKPDPMKSVLMGAILPGYGQFLNRKYWKLPIVYGGFLGCSYFINWNSVRYSAYKTAYKDITDTDPGTNSFIDILPSGYTVDTYGGLSQYAEVLKSGMEKARYYRDLSIIISVGYYLLTLVDAYVDAQLYDFDISPDLSMRLTPALLENNFGRKNSVGLQVSINLK